LRIDFLEAEDPRWPDWLSELHHDIYHLPAYVAFAARRQEVGEPLLFVAQEADRRLLIPLIIRPISPELAGDTISLFDATCPRGYPGPLVSLAHGGRGDDFLEQAILAFCAALRDRHVVTAFIRLHPLLVLQTAPLERAGQIVDHGSSVSIDLSLPPEELWRQTRDNHRRDILRARRRGYVARIDESEQAFEGFIDIYQRSMDRVGAASFWRLSRDYLHELRKSLRGNLHLCVVETDGDLAAAALLTEVDGLVEYHIAATADAHVHASPSKLLIDFARSWARSRGNRRLHLAGSLREGDPLSHFKLGFSPFQHRVLTWRLIADVTFHDVLVERWKRAAEEHVDPGDGYFPAYRRPLKS
jgi:CelD/BcsL family acetyltransferase involved in cellulose biosynthesis